jgi:hypothetical protein
MDKLKIWKEKLKELIQSEYNYDLNWSNLSDTFILIKSRKINQKFDKMRKNDK